MLHRASEELMDLVDLCKIGLDGNRSDTVFLNRLDRRQSRLLARGVVDDYVSTELSKSRGDSLANTAPPTGYQSDLP